MRNGGILLSSSRFARRSRLALPERHQQHGVADAPQIAGRLQEEPAPLALVIKRRPGSRSLPLGRTKRPARSPTAVGHFTRWVTTGSSGARKTSRNGGRSCRGRPASSARHSPWENGTRRGRNANGMAIISRSLFRRTAAATIHREITKNLQGAGLFKLVSHRRLWRNRPLLCRDLRKIFLSC